MCFIPDPSLLRGRLYSHHAFVEDFSKNHVDLTLLQRALLTVGSAAVSFMDPYRHDMIACLGETTGERALAYCLEKMKSTDEGQRILEEKPRINSQTVDLSYLQNLPYGTIGKTYSKFLEVNVGFIIFDFEKFAI